MNARKWNKGLPPHVGWWNASRCRAQDCWRWWDGKQWSFPAPLGRERGVAERARQKAGNQARIEWTDFYPEGARVPRVAP